MRAFLPALLALLSPGWASDATGSSATPSWWGEVSARIRDGAHAFHPDGEGWTASSPETGLRGTFDREGVWLGHDGAQVHVRTARWGRTGAWVEASPIAPELGACSFDQEDSAGACVRSLAYQGAGLTEVWSSTDQGFEQRWIIDAPPEGEGDLLVDVAVEGADVSVREDDLWLDGEDGEAWVMRGFAAWGADGVPVALSLERTADGFRVRLQDETARYPVTVDPVYGTAATTLTGEAEGDAFGYAVSGAGDVNADGYDDVIVGVYGWSAGVYGAYVFEGSAAGVSSTASASLDCEASGCALGETVAGVGDINGDGYDDLVVGDSDGNTAFVFLGSASGVFTTPATTLKGGTWFGSAVAGAGDVNGDGYDDVIVGAWGYDSQTGRAYVYLGSASGVSTTPATTLTGEAEGDDFGRAVSGAGDVNGDGYDDIIIGAEGYGPYYDKVGYKGRAYVYQGSASGVSTTAAFTSTGESYYEYLGSGVSGAGDVNGDGYGDVVVGISGYNHYSGAATIYYGSSAGLDLTFATILAGESDFSFFGWPVSRAGDVNGDTYDDVIVGAPYYLDYGRAYVFEGSACGISTRASTTLTGEAENDSFGISVSKAGDVNGDGYADVIVGAPGHDGNTGQASIYLGVASEVDTADTGTSDTGCGDSGDDTGDDTEAVDTSDSGASDSDSDSDTGETDSGDGEDTASDSMPTTDDTAPGADDPAKDIPDCGCTAAGSGQIWWSLALLPLIGLRRRCRAFLL